MSTVNLTEIIIYGGPYFIQSFYQLIYRWQKKEQQQQETSESISLKACLTQANEYTDDSVSLDINFMRGPGPHS